MPTVAAGIGHWPPEKQIAWLTDALHNLSMMSHADVERMEIHLLKYGHHLDDCDPASTLPGSCGCGWRQVVAEVWPR